MNKYAVFSSTNNSMYDFFIPITAWLWRKLGYTPICFIPTSPWPQINLISSMIGDGVDCRFRGFTAPEHKLATYAQNVRLFACAMEEIKDKDLIVSTDCDMGVFNDVFQYDDYFNILGADLVPTGQYPVCFCSAKASVWRTAFRTAGKSYQQMLDDKFGNDECEDYRACRWSTDQELIYSSVAHGAVPVALQNRAYPGTQFAKNRLDRDDGMYETMLRHDTIDFHYFRPGYEPENFTKIMRVLHYFYPSDDLSWIVDYREKYLAL